MPKTIWRHPIKPDKIITKCELMGVCQCDKDNVKCGIKIIGKDNLSKNKDGNKGL